MTGAGHVHSHGVPETVRVAVLTLSSTRAESDDSSGGWMVAALRERGHDVAWYGVRPDIAGVITETVTGVLREHRPHVLITTGGTGITGRDVTIEAVTPLFRKRLSAFGALFAHLGFAEVGSRALLSRASAGVIDDTVVFCLPGSLDACRLACERLIFPELGHLARHVREA